MLETDSRSRDGEENMYWSPSQDEKYELEGERKDGITSFGREKSRKVELHKDGPF